MPYEWVEHTAELELRIEAQTAEAVLGEALLALSELIGDGTTGESVEYEVVVGGRDRATVLARWIDELVYRAETEDLVPDRVERVALCGATLRATVRGHRGEPRHVVKGATYHRLSFGPSAAGFSATVVLDV